MTGYGIGEAAIAALVDDVTGFSTSTVSRGNWKVLNQGKAAVYAILRTQPSGDRIFETPKTVREQWITEVQIWQRYTVDGTTYTNLAANVDLVLVQLDKYPHLGDTSGYVEDSTAARLGECEEMWTRSGGPAWLRQTIYVEWTGRRSITFSD